MSFRFVHSSDLHIGRAYRAVADDAGLGLRGRLIEARHSALQRLADVARDAGARHILLAGDTFDSPTPARATLAQAIAVMAEDPALTWWVLPGNHDNLHEAEPLWEALSQASNNVRPLLTASPQAMAPDVHLLTAPVTYRNSGQDLTAPFSSMDTPEGAYRLGLAHGGVTAFDDGDSADIAPDRAETAGLDYLALGDWHGCKKITDRTYYSGTPEQDRFKHNRRGVALVVTIPGPGAAPEVQDIETGQFLWQSQTLEVQPNTAPADEIARHLPSTGRRETLVQVALTGRCALSDHHSYVEALSDVAPAFASLTWTDAGLSILADTTDLDAMETAGPLRATANRLATQADDPTLSDQDRRLAAAALTRLYGIVRELAP